MKIKDSRLRFDHDEFGNVSEEAKDLIRKCLCVREKKRLSGQEALNHPWFHQDLNTVTQLR